MGKQSRDKGAAEERRVCRLLKAHRWSARRALSQYQASSGRDIEHDPNLDLDALPFCIQVKGQKSISVLAALREARSACGEDECPVAWLHWTHGEKVVVIPEEAFIVLIGALRNVGWNLAEEMRNVKNRQPV